MSTGWGSEVVVIGESGMLGTEGPSTAPSLNQYLKESVSSPFPPQWDGMGDGQEPSTHGSTGK